MNDANRQIDAYLRAADRHLSRGETEKAEQHLKAATLTAEAHGIPHYGRYTLQSITRRHVQHEQQAHERRLKNREPMPVPTTPETTAPAQLSAPRNPK